MRSHGSRRSRADAGSRTERVVGDLLGTSPAPPSLWVANSPLTDAMAPPHRRPPLDLGDHHDWLLVAGEDLTLVRYHPARRHQSRVELRAPWADVAITTSDHGELHRRRAIVVELRDESWMAFGAPLSRHGRDRVERFTTELFTRSAMPPSA